MKTLILTIAFSSAAFFLLACRDTTTTANRPVPPANADVNTNGATNHNGTAQGATNQNTPMNHNGMDHNTMIHDEMMDHSEMKSDAGAASEPYDQQFIDTMMLHHEGAIQMSEMILSKTVNKDLKKFAQQIIDDQRKEMAQMKEWREKWFKGKPAARNMEMPGMKDSMKMMSGDDMKKMSQMTGRDLDLHFLGMMIPHHEGALAMAKDALEKAEREEIKTLAKSIMMAQEAEIKQMQDWKTQWAK